MRNNKVRDISMSAMFIAVSVIICIVASVFPTMTLSIAAMAGIVTAIAVINLGYKYACLVYFATSVLLWLMVPDKQCALYYSVLFGHYPILKLFTERIGKKLLVCIVKAAEINILFVIVYFMLCFISGMECIPFFWEILFYWIVFNLLFFLYDICIGRISFMYIARISKNNRFH